MKNFRYFFILSIIYIFTIAVSTQTIATEKNNSTLLCQEQTKSTTHKATTEVNVPKKSLTTTKQRRLKSYHSNHKINRKRKAIIPENIIAIKD